METGTSEYRFDQKFCSVYCEAWQTEELPSKVLREDGLYALPMTGGGPCGLCGDQAFKFKGEALATPLSLRY